MTLQSRETINSGLFQINGDRRVLQSKAYIYKALRLLLETKPFEKISISELTKKAGVGRATFYRNFGVLDDVLNQQSKDLLTLYQISLEGKQNLNSQDRLTHFFNFWTVHHEYLETLALAKRKNILNHFMDALNQKELKKMVDDWGELDSVGEEYFLTVVRNILNGVLFHWIEREKKETPEQLSQYVLIPFQFYVHKESMNQC